MKSLLILTFMLALGVGLGGGAGILMAPPKTAPDESCDQTDSAKCDTTSEDTPDDAEDDAPSGPSPDDEPFDYVKLNNQFVIPIIREQRVSALVVVSITLEIEAGNSTLVFDREPRLRDAILQEMFDFAYLGGFDGPFTKSENLTSLRRALREISRRIVGDTVNDVLIVDLVRQEV